MKIKFYEEDDILVFRFSNKPVDDSYEVGEGLEAVLEVDKNNEPVSLEILRASEFLKKQGEVLSRKAKQAYFASA